MYRRAKRRIGSAYLRPGFAWKHSPDVCPTSALDAVWWSILQPSVRHLQFLRTPRSVMGWHVRNPAAARATEPPTPPARPLIRVIPPDAIMRLEELRVVLNLSKTCLRREARAGRLKVARRGGCYW